MLFTSASNLVLEVYILAHGFHCVDLPVFLSLHKTNLSAKTGTDSDTKSAVLPMRHVSHCFKYERERARESERER